MKVLYLLLVIKKSSSLLSIILKMRGRRRLCALISPARTFSSCHDSCRSWCTKEKHESVVQKIVSLKEALCIVQEEERQHKDDVEAKSLVLTTAEKEVDEQSKVLADLEISPTPLLDDVVELERHEPVMLEMQSSHNSDTWMSTNWFRTHSILLLLHFDAEWTLMISFMLFTIRNMFGCPLLSHSFVCLILIALGNLYLSSYHLTCANFDCLFFHP